jgi:glycosyltransferase involved in cell wall biosynthesis
MNARVLQILPDLVPYGLERVVGSLALLADRSRFEVSVCSLYADQPGSLTADLRAAGVHVEFLDKRRGFDPRMFYRLSALFGRLRPDVVHTHNYVLRYVLPAAWGRRIPVIVHTIHNVADREVDRAGVWLQQRAFRKRVQPVVIAAEAAASFERVYNTPAPPLIMNGIPVARYARDQKRRDAWRAREGFSAADLLSVCVARFYPQKNHRTLIDAFAQGPARLPNSRLLLAGDGDGRPAVEQQVRELGLADRVHFLGRREDVADLLAASDIFALASLWEGNPLSVMEAMAAGLAPVVTAVGGVPELVRSGFQGLVVPPGDAGALADAWLRLATNSEERAEMARSAAAHALETFDEAHMVETYEKLYDRLLDTAFAGRAGYWPVRAPSTGR